MTELALHVEHLSKSFRLGRHEHYYRFTEFIENIARNVVRSPFRWLTRSRAGEGSAQLSSSSSQFRALDDVTFDLPRGEVLGIVGRNGAGKSTLLKLLSRITHPTKGRIELTGRVGSLLEVGTGFHPELTGRENIFLNGAVLGMSHGEIRRKFDEIVAFAETERFLDTQVKHYSSGMQMRLAFAVAAHLEPEILIVDEVLAVGDAAFQKKCLGKIGDAAHGGRTILFVSHNMSAVASLAQRVLWLDGGKVRRIGPARSVIDEYLNSGQALGRERIWGETEAAPGNEQVCLRAIRLREPSGDAQALTVRTAFDVEHEIEVHRPVSEFKISMVLYDRERHCIFNSVSPCEAVAPGRYRLSVRIPANLLNKGGHRIRVLLAERQVTFADVWDVLDFEVHDDQRDFGYYGEWIGAVRPQLDWDKQAL